MAGPGATGAVRPKEPTILRKAFAIVPRFIQRILRKGGNAPPTLQPMPAPIQDVEYATRRLMGEIPDVSVPDGLSLFNEIEGEDYETTFQRYGLYLSRMDDSTATRGDDKGQDEAQRSIPQGLRRRGPINFEELARAEASLSIFANRQNEEQQLVVYERPQASSAAPSGLSESTSQTTLHQVESSDVDIKKEMAKFDKKLRTKSGHWSDSPSVGTGEEEEAFNAPPFPPSSQPYSSYPLQDMQVGFLYNQPFANPDVYGEKRTPTLPLGITSPVSPGSPFPASGPWIPPLLSRSPSLEAQIQDDIGPQHSPILNQQWRPQLASEPYSGRTTRHARNKSVIASSNPLPLLLAQSRRAPTGGEYSRRGAAHVRQMPSIQEGSTLDSFSGRRQSIRKFERGDRLQPLRLGLALTPAPQPSAPATGFYERSSFSSPFNSAYPTPTRQPIVEPPVLGSSSGSFLQKGTPARHEPWLRPSISRAAMDNINRLTVRPQEANQVKAKAVEDARQMQAKVNEECKKTGKDPPPYALEELIGKGSFGRVYKGKDMKSAAVVAVKIIDIDESDTINPRNADSYSEFLKEVNALKILGENKARNINLVIAALPVAQSMWMITEFCGGGSVATLMKPTAPGGLNEKWIIPILREVAEAIKWVHEAGIIHRDIKCANVLVTESGDVQLCDFGVAGIVESKIDKRSTVIGTPHWMAPELFGSSPSYGSEVDIWAFGSMVFEIATGLPPNVANGISYDRLGSHLKHHTPRLEGGDYSNNIRDLVAFCLEEDPRARPPIDKVQKHPYILNTSSSFPTSSLKALVGSFKVWESRGGSRKSLFMHGGAQGPAPSFLSNEDDEWNFNSTGYFEGNVWGQYGVQDVIEAYGPAVAGFVDETARPAAKVSRRRPPPEALSRLPAAPLEKIFDPNTMSNYEDNSRAHYGRHMMQSGSVDRSDLPLRDDSAQTSIRDTMIDLGGHDVETGLSSFPDMDTIKADRRDRDGGDEDDHTLTLPSFGRSASSDPAEVNSNRRTQDWKFPSMAPPVSADPELSRFPSTYEVPRPSMTPGSGRRPTLVHHPTEPLGAFGGALGPAQPVLDRMSMRESLIDLDMSMPDPITEYPRPSTANSDVGSTTSEHMPNPFEYEQHSSMYQPISAPRGREPSIYVSDESSLPPQLRNGNTLQDLADMSDFSASDAESISGRRRGNAAPFEDSDDGYHGNVGTSNGDRESRTGAPTSDAPDDADYLSMADRPFQPAQAATLPPLNSLSADSFPELPAQPSRASLTGSASKAEMKTEITRMVAAMSSQLETFKDVYEKDPRHRSVPGRDRESTD